MSDTRLTRFVRATYLVILCVYVTLAIMILAPTGSVRGAVAFLREPSAAFFWLFLMNIVGLAFSSYMFRRHTRLALLSIGPALLLVLGVIWIVRELSSPTPNSAFVLYAAGYSILHVVALISLTHQRKRTDTFVQ
jgi:peptidoglycan/LPS O-acetylase OafA/YrhL